MSSRAESSRAVVLKTLVFVLLLALLGLSLHLRLDPPRHLAPDLEPYVSTGEGDLYFYTKDSFLYFRQSENVVEHGHAGERLEDGRPWDAFSSAPEGRPTPPSLLAWVQVLVHRALPGEASLQAVAFILPAVLGSLLLLPLFLLGRDLCGNLGGLAAALLAAVHPELISHCHAGIADTTSLNLLFLASGTWLASRGLDALAARRWRAAGLYALPLLLVMALFRATWTAWTALPALVAGLLGLYLLGRLLARASSPRQKQVVIGVIVLAAALGLFAVARSDLGLKLLRYSGPEGTSLFPTGLEQVAELAPLDAGQLVRRLGGWLLLALAAAGAALGFGTRRGQRLRTAALLGWGLPAAAAGLFSMRFVVYAVPPLAVLAGLGLAAGTDFITRRLGARFEGSSLGKWSQELAGLGAAALIAFLVWDFGNDVQAFASRRPAADKAVAETAEQIRSTAGPEAQINTWWDSGYVYSALADRAATLDGGSLTRERLYWFSRALATPDENEALNLLRWINCGVEGKALQQLARHTGRSFAARFLQEAAKEPSQEAVTEYFERQDLPPAAIAEVTETLDCQPPEAWLVVGSDLLGKTNAWYRYGSRELGEEVPAVEGAFTTAEIPCNLQPQGFSCANGMGIDIVAGGWENLSSPRHLAVRGRPQPDGWTGIIYQVSQDFAHLWVRGGLEESLFARLYFFHGRDLEHFRLAYDARYPPYTQRVLAFRIEW